MNEIRTEKHFVELKSIRKMKQFCPIFGMQFNMKIYCLKKKKKKPQKLLEKEKERLFKARSN